MSGAQAPAQMTRAELLSLLEKDAKHPELLYQKDYINRFGLTADTKEPYTAVAAGWLTGHRDLWMGVAHGLYRLVEGNRVSIMMKDPDLQGSASSASFLLLAKCCLSRSCFWEIGRRS